MTDLFRATRRRFLAGALATPFLTSTKAFAMPFTQEPKTEKGTLTFLPAFDSAHVTARDIAVWQPEAELHDGPLPVIYVHDGEAIFDADASPYGTAWQLDLIATMLAHQGVGPAIIVGIAADAERRSREYNAPSVAKYLDAEMQDILAQSCGGPLLTGDYLRFVVEEVKPYVDSHFDTRPDRDNTYVMGASMGGLLVLETLMSQRDVFAGGVGFSAHLFLLGPDAYQMQLPEDTPARIEAALREAVSTDFPDPGATKVYFQRGTVDLDSFYGGSHTAVAEGLLRKGYLFGDDFVMRRDVGAGHSDTYWTLRAPEAMRFLLT